MMHVQRRDPFPFGLAGIRPLDDYKVALGATQLPTCKLMPSLRLDAVDTSTTARSALSGRQRIALHCALCAFFAAWYSLSALRESTSPSVGCGGASSRAAFTP